MKGVYQQRPKTNEHSRLGEDQVSVTCWKCPSCLRNGTKTLVGKEGFRELQEIKAEKKILQQNHVGSHWPF